MSQEHITSTGERWRERGGVIEVGISADMQDALGAVIFVQLPAIGAAILEGEHLGVVEGALTAAEIYAPCSGHVVWVAGSDAKGSDWLARIAPIDKNRAGALRSKGSAD